jgi:hypothetical protein
MAVKKSAPKKSSKPKAAPKKAAPKKAPKKASGSKAKAKMKAAPAKKASPIKLTDPQKKLLSDVSQIKAPGYMGNKKDAKTLSQLLQKKLIKAVGKKEGGFFHYMVTKLGEKYIPPAPAPPAPAAEAAPAVPSPTPLS